MKLEHPDLDGVLRRHAGRPAVGWGNTPWLNAPMNITDWGHRAVPNVYLTSAFKSKGVWNAAHYSNKAFDRPAKSYIGAIALKDAAEVRGADAAHPAARHAGHHPVLLQLPRRAGSKKVKGYKADAQGTVYLSQTSLA